MTRRARLWTTVAGLATLILVAGVCLGWWAWTTLQRPHKGYPQVDIVHEVLPGQDAGTILRDLESRGVLSNAFLTRLYLVRVLGDPPLRAGEYRFDTPLTAPEVLGKLVAGEVVTYPVTIVEGLTLEETAAHLASEGFGDRDRLLEEMLSRKGSRTSIRWRRISRATSSRTPTPLPRAPRKRRSSRPWSIHFGDCSSKRCAPLCLPMTHALPGRS